LGHKVKLVKLAQPGRQVQRDLQALPDQPEPQVQTERTAQPVPPVPLEPLEQLARKDLWVQLARKVRLV
jgi:hypothetical protein